MAIRPYMIHIVYGTIAIVPTTFVQFTRKGLNGYRHVLVILLFLVFFVFPLSFVKLLLLRLFPDIIVTRLYNR